MVFVISFSVVTYAYISYAYGYVSDSIPIENRTSYSTAYSRAKNAWNNTATPAYIYDIAGSGHSWIHDESYSDTFIGQYNPISLQYGVSGRATKFEIKLNRTKLVGHTTNYIQSTIVHELGHALCLNDNPPQSPSIMRYDRNRETCITPQQDDINGVNAAY